LDEKHVKNVLFAVTISCVNFVDFFLTAIHQLLLKENELYANQETLIHFHALFGERISLRNWCDC
jgi:hypothetical protein